MARRIVSHKKKILSEASISESNIKTGMLLNFNYYSKSFDKNPLVYCMQVDNKNKLISGFNLNYLSEYEAHSVLKEEKVTDMTNYPMYKHSFRSYKISKITMLKEVGYDLDYEKGKYSINKDTTLDSLEKKQERQEKNKSRRGKIIK